MIQMGTLAALSTPTSLKLVLVILILLILTCFRHYLLFIYYEKEETPQNSHIILSLIVL